MSNLLKIQELEEIIEEEKYVNNSFKDFAILLGKDPLDKNNKQKYFKYVLKQVANLIGFERGGLCLIKDKDKRYPPLGKVLKNKYYVEDTSFFGVPKEFEKKNLYRTYNLKMCRGPPTFALKLKEPIQMCNNKKVLEELVEKGVIENSEEYIKTKRKFYLEFKKNKKFKGTFKNFDSAIKELVFPLLYEEDILGIVNFDTPTMFNVNDPIPKHTINSGMKITNTLIPLILEGIYQNRLSDILKKNIPKKLAEYAIKDQSKFYRLLNGVKRDITCLFVDIEAYSKYVEKKDSTEVISKLNEYNKIMDDIILNKYKGIIAKHPGDGIFCIFNGLGYQKNHAEKAIKCGLEMQEAIKILNKGWKNSGEEEIKVNMGINTGIATMGNVGSRERIEYSAIGNTINVAGRLEGYATKGKIIISEKTYNHLENKSQFAFSDVDEIKVKNIEKLIKIYQINY